MSFDKRKALQNALLYTQQGKWDRAVAEYQAILKADPNDLSVCNNLGDLYARGGRIAEAITKLLGKKYEAEITEMDFNPGNMADTLDCVACKLTLSKLFKS
jgi:tetratricopeptide (TPR) repeat protein